MVSRVGQCGHSFISLASPGSCYSVRSRQEETQREIALSPKCIDMTSHGCSCYAHFAPGNCATLTKLCVVIMY